MNVLPPVTLPFCNTLFLCLWPYIQKTLMAAIAGIYILAIMCMPIRASVDALCRDGAGQISRERV